MPSLTADFDELVRRIQAGREFSHASFEPIYYLVFHPREILEVKRQMPAWTARLKNAGWKVTEFSVAEHICDIFQSAPMRKVWLAADAKAPLDWEKTNKSLANALTGRDQLQKRLEEVISEQKDDPNAIVLVSDLEALHPYLRIGAIEAQLQGKFHIPTIFFYPGVRTGKTRLRFLGFYPEDGNYRSVHVGG
ncbi:BREX protein BrxB domain-containing protein [Sulfitobacter mediterraneus]|uniref:BREX protein BrxB domain-containing protein n=1 Tax=Sulfitobacter mediterraneus TaxID=83219 RepID=UPI000EA0EA50|nr:BREX protein BrxB domain-containing protein [Sulfitobacter mediterraneus]